MEDGRGKMEEKTMQNAKIIRREKMKDPFEKPNPYALRLALRALRLTSSIFHLPSSVSPMPPALCVFRSLHLLKRVQGSCFHLPSSIFHLLKRAQGSCFHLPSSLFPLPSPRAPRFALCAIPLDCFWGRSSSPAYGDMRDQLSNLHPYISLQGLYDDNLFLTQDNKTSDFITTVTPGLKYKNEGPAHKFDLGFDLGMNFYASHSDLNYISYEGTWIPFIPSPPAGPSSYLIPLPAPGTICRAIRSLPPADPRPLRLPAPARGCTSAISSSLRSNTNSGGKMWPT